MGKNERELEEIEKRVDAATGGLWECIEVRGSPILAHEVERRGLYIGGPHIAKFYRWNGQGNRDALFCAHARQDIPNLLKEVRRSHAEAAELRERLAWCTDRRAELAKALGKDDEELPWEDVKLEISKWEELEKENAELRKKMRDIGKLEEELAIRVREFLDAEREVVQGWNENAELREDLQAVEGMLKGATDGWAEEKVENAELRERVESLEGVLRAAQKDLDFVDGLFASDDPALIGNTPSGIWRLDISNISQKIDTALRPQANAQAKQGGAKRSEEEERDE